MSLNVSGLSVYTEENKSELIRRAILEGRSMDYVVVQGDIKSSMKLNFFDTNIVAQAGSCGFNADGETTLTQKDISVDDIKINEAICVQELEQFYIQTKMKKGSYQDELPFEAIYSATKADKISEMLELMVWKGNKSTGTGNLSHSEGFLSRIDASGDTIDGNVSGATGSINASNVVTIVNDMVASIPTEIIDQDDLVLFVGYEVYRLYAKELMEANLFHYKGEEGDDFIMNAPGTNVKIVAVKGLNSTSRLVLTRIANLYVGTDLLSDAEQFRLYYSEDNDQVRFISKFKIGTQIAFDELVVEFTLV